MCLGQRSRAREAARALPQAVLVGEIGQALAGRAVARVGDEAMGLGEGGRADELRARGERLARRVAGAALQAQHGLGDLVPLARGHEPLAVGIGRRPGRREPRPHATDLAPEHLQIGHQVLDDRHVRQRRDDDGGTVLSPPLRDQRRLLHDVRELGVAGEARAAVDAHRASAADAVPAGAAKGQAAVLVLLHGHQRLEHGRAVGELDREALGVAAAGRGRGRSARSRASPAPSVGDLHVADAPDHQ